MRNIRPYAASCPTWPLPLLRDKERPSAIGMGSPRSCDGIYKHHQLLKDPNTTPRTSMAINERRELQSGVRRAHPLPLLLQAVPQGWKNATSSLDHPYPKALWQAVRAHFGVHLGPSYEYGFVVPTVHWR